MYLSVEGRNPSQIASPAFTLDMVLGIKVAGRIMIDASYGLCKQVWFGTGPLPFTSHTRIPQKDDEPGHGHMYYRANLSRILTVEFAIYTLYSVHDRFESNIR